MRPLFIGILLGLLLAAVTTVAISADQPAGLNAGAWAASQAAAASAAGAAVKTTQTAAQQVAVTVNQPAAASSSGGSKTTTLRTVPDAYAPTMNATAPCRISVSAGVAVIGIGVSGGGSVEDDPCNLRETARLLDGIGQREAAARVMCADPRAAAALGDDICLRVVVLGREKRTAEADLTSAGQTSASAICDQAAQYDDPVLAARNGCPGW